MMLRHEVKYVLLQTARPVERLAEPPPALTVALAYATDISPTAVAVVLLQLHRDNRVFSWAIYIVPPAVPRGFRSARGDMNVVYPILGILHPVLTGLRTPVALVPSKQKDQDWHEVKTALDW
jgi:hypothetical protein